MKHEKLERQLLENPDYEARVKTSGEGLEEEGGGEVHSPFHFIGNMCWK